MLACRRHVIVPACGMFAHGPVDQALAELAEPRNCGGGGAGLPLRWRLPEARSCGAVPASACVMAWQEGIVALNWPVKAPTGEFTSSRQNRGIPRSGATRSCAATASRC